MRRTENQTTLPRQELDRVPFVCAHNPFFNAPLGLIAIYFINNVICPLLLKNLYSLKLNLYP